jgi:thiol-disulfide isomerase/thioredoxin
MKRRDSRHLAANLLACASIVAALIYLPWPNSTCAAERTSTPRKKIYDISADGAKQIQEALAAAASDDKHVLLQFGGDWCIPCVKLHSLFETNKAISQTLKSNYVVVYIDSNDKNKHLATTYRAKEMGLPFIVVLSADGTRLTTKNTAELEEGDRHNPEKVLAFLNEWTPQGYAAFRAKPIADLVQQYLQKPQHADRSIEFEQIHARAGEAVFELIEVIRGTNNEHRIQAYRVLGELGPRARSAVSFLAGQFTTNNDLVQFTAVTLPKLGPEAKGVIPSLASILQATDLTAVLQERAERSDPRSWLLFNAAHCLAKLDPEHPQLIPAMLLWLKSPNTFCRRGAPRVLAEIGPAAKDAIPALRQAAADSDETVRQAARQAIEKIEM